MKTKIAILLLVNVFFFNACSKLHPDSTHQDAPATAVTTTPTQPQVTPESTSVNTTQWETPTPETLAGYPTPQNKFPFPACDATGGDCINFETNIQRQDIAFHELYVGKYVLRNWCNDSPQTLLPICGVTISSNNIEQIEEWGFPARFGKETGAYLTGNGKPDIIINDYSGGNCCVSTIIYEADENLKKVMDIGSYRIGTFTDLDGNGSFEYIAPYRIWSQFCTACSGVVIPTIYEYQGSSGYSLANHKFPEYIQADIQTNLDTLSSFNEKYPDVDIQFDEYNFSDPGYGPAVGSLYRIVLSYILSGQEENASIFLSEYFSPEQVSAYIAGSYNDLGNLVTP